MSEADQPLEPVPWRPVAAIGGSIFVLLMAVSTRYGWHRDELYFLQAGKHHLAWGYIDQPPFTPFIARLADQIAPGNLAVLRLLPAVTAVATIVMGTLIARELGRRATGRSWPPARWPRVGSPSGSGTSSPPPRSTSPPG